jgi:hypothetical protein
MANVFSVPGVPSLTSYLPGALTLLSSDFAPGAPGGIGVSSLINAGAQAVLQWGVFRNGQPIILPRTNLTAGLSNFSIINAFASAFINLTPTIFPVVASFVDVEFKQDWPASDYPVEQGGFQTYDKVRLPFAVKLRLAASGSQAELQSFLTTIQNVCEDGSLGNPSLVQSLVTQALGGFGINTAQISSIFGTITGGNNLYDLITPSRVFTGMTAIHYDYRRTAVSGVSLITVDIWFIEVQVTVSANLNATQFAQFAGQNNVGTVGPQTFTGALGGFY